MKDTKHQDVVRVDPIEHAMLPNSDEPDSFPQQLIKASQVREGHHMLEGVSELRLIPLDRTSAPSVEAKVEDRPDVGQGAISEDKLQPNGHHVCEDGCPTSLRRWPA